MKRVSSISLLILFCVYSFTFKTHYCFYADTHERFHGDCEHEIKEAEKKGELAHSNFFPKHYVCNDIVKNAQPNQTKILPIKNYSSNVLIIPTVVEIPLPDFSFLDWNIPETHCRSATLLLSNSIHAPPFC